MQIKITVTKNLAPELIKQIKLQGPRIVASIAQGIEAQAKLKAPVDTGFLRNSIQATPKGAFEWNVTVGAEYGAYLEFGTVKMSARPYFTPAVELMRPQFEMMLNKLLEL